MRSYMTDHRTPLAWRHRDMHSPRPHPGLHHHHHHGGHHPPRPPATSSVTTSSSDEREEVPMVRHPQHHHPQHHHRRPHSRAASRYGREANSQFSAAEPYPAGGPFRNNGGTLRSTRSVPALALATWDGEPCPVHGHGLPLHHHPYHHPYHHPAPPPSTAGTMRRHGSLFDMRGPPPFMGPPFPFPPPMIEKKSFHGSLQMMMPPYHLVPPMMRPRPLVIPAEPLPIRDPFKMRTPPGSGYAGSGKAADDPYGNDQVCCKGHLIVLWIILAVVTIGVILGIVLGVTIA